MQSKSDFIRWRNHLHLRSPCHDRAYYWQRKQSYDYGQDSKDLDQDLDDENLTFLMPIYRQNPRMARRTSSLVLPPTNISPAMNRSCSLKNKFVTNSTRGAFINHVDNIGSK